MQVMVECTHCSWTGKAETGDYKKGIPFSNQVCPKCHSRIRYKSSRPKWGDPYLFRNEKAEFKEEKKEKSSRKNSRRKEERKAIPKIKLTELEEIKNCEQIILCYIELLSRNEKSTQQEQRSLKQIKSQVWRMNKIIEKLWKRQQKGERGKYKVERFSDGFIN